MRAIHRKLLRDLAGLRAQVATTAILVICGVSLLLASWSAYRSLKASRDDYYRDYAFADLFSEMKRAPLDIARKIERIPGVLRAEPRIVIDGLIDLEEREPAVGRFVSVPWDGQPALNKIYLRQGRLPSMQRSIEVVIHEGFAKANGINIGDRLKVLVQGKKESITVVGIGLSPEYVYALSPAAPLPDDRHFGVIWMPSKPLERLARLSDAFNSISVAADKTKLNPITREIDEILKPYGSVGAYTRDTQPSSQFVNDEILQQKASAMLTPSIFLGVAAFLIQIIVSRLLSMQRSQIATLKAIGYTNAEVSFHYLTLVVLIMIIGTIPGIGLGALLGKLIAKGYEDFFRFPKLDFSLNLSAALAGLAAGILPGIAGAFAGIRSTFKLPPAEAMRPPAPPAFHEGLIERLGFQKKIGVRQRIVFRNLLFRPVRLGLSILGMSLAIAVVVASMAWKDIIRFLLDTQFQRIQREDISLSLVHPVKLGGLQEILGLAGVLEAEGYRVVPVRIRYLNHKRELPLTGWPRNARMRQRLGTNLKVIPLPSEGLLLSRFFEKSWGVARGDLVKLEVLEGRRQSITIPVSGFTDDLVGIAANMNIQAVWRLMGEEPSYNLALLRVDPRKSATLYVKLKELPEVATANFKSSLYRGFQESMGKMIRWTTGILIAFALAIAIGVIYNSIRVSFSERAWEMASLRVLGFKMSETFSILLTETGLQVVLCLAPGCVLGFGLTHLILKGVNTETFGFPVIIGRASYTIAILTIVGAFILSAAVMLRTFKKQSLAEALKARD